MLAALRCIHSDTITGVHRTRLTPDGRKVDRRMLGIASGSAIKIDPDEAVTVGLVVAEGIETALAARQIGFRPVWALGSVSAIRALPILNGVDALTILGETGTASAEAIQVCGARWSQAGREVVVVEPLVGDDINDAILGCPA
jgi:hypothetical protein